jgi:hypothetical protein
MNEPAKAFITTLYESYDTNPTIKGLIQALSLSGMPIGPIIDSTIGTFVNKMKSDRLHTFFDALNSGDITISEEQIESNDFLHAYFSTVNYVIRTRSDNKIESFARILKNLNVGRINIAEFEDYTSIFNELSEREFTILSIKHKYEQDHKEDVTEMNPAQLTSSYWSDFVKTTCSRLSMSQEELDSMLVRIQRTGCYNKHKGYWEDGPNERGNTTELFRIIYELIISK